MRYTILMLGLLGLTGCASKTVKEATPCPSNTKMLVHAAGIGQNSPEVALEKALENARKACENNGFSSVNVGRMLYRYDQSRMASMGGSMLYPLYDTEIEVWCLDKQ